jgi:hypothetical protein
MSNALHFPCDAAAARAVEPAASTDHPRLVIAMTILACSLRFVDGSVVNAGLPAIAADFHANAGDLQCIVNACLSPKNQELLLEPAAALLIREAPENKNGEGNT